MTQEKTILKLNIKSFDIIRLEKFTNLILLGCRSRNILIKGPIRLPVKIKKMTVLKSPHVNKKAREQFEIRTYHRLFILESKTKDRILFYINKLKKYIPIGIQLKSIKINQV